MANTPHTRRVLDAAVMVAQAQQTVDEVAAIASASGADALMDPTVIAAAFAMQLAVRALTEAVVDAQAAHDSQWN